MKFFSLALAAAVAANVPEPAQSRTRRNDVVEYKLDGTESPDDLMNIIVSITGSESDDIEKAIMATMGVDRLETTDQIRKFRNLKIVVLWLQTTQQFGKYCYYGCYCLPEGSHDIAAGGYGRPLDGIDRACFDFKQCYHCLVDEHDDDNLTHDGKCRGEELGYRVDLLTDSVTGKKSLQCLNKAGTCRRNICECDKRLAEQFSKYEAEWNESYHANRGGFNRDENCFKGNGNGNPFERCCGDRFDFPLNQPKHLNQCCDGPIAKNNGEC